MTNPDYFEQPELAGHRKVMEVLRRWDPIGVIGECNQDEYDSYAVAFVSLLDRGTTVEQLVVAMRELAMGHMGLPATDEPHTRSCAVELVEFWRAWKAR